MVLIYILKVYRKKSSSILFTKKNLNSLFALFCWKACTFSSFERFSAENPETTPSTFLRKFFSEIYLSWIINYWGSIFALYLTSRAFSLVCVLSIFLSFFLSFSLFFFFYRYFPWQILTIQRIAGKGEAPLTNIHLVHQDFYHFFLIDLFVITRLIADEACSP